MFFFKAWIGSLSVGVQFFFCFMSSMLIDLFSIRKIGLLGSLISTVAIFSCSFVTQLSIYFLTYAVLFGIGQALLLTSSSAILSHYFKKKLSLANGVMNFVGSLIVIVLPILTSTFLDKFGLKEMFFLLSGMNFITIICAMTYKSQMPNPNRDIEKTIWNRVKSSFGIDIFKNKQFIMWGLTSLICLFGYLIPIVNIVRFNKKI